MNKRLYRSRKDKKIAGVCAGFGDYCDIDPTFVRLGLVALSLFAGGGIIFYIIAAVVIPLEPEENEGN
jgi:phage shock protein C